MRVACKFGLLMAAACLAAGCQDLFAPKGTAVSRDYGELINRMMNSIKGRTPEDAAINLFNTTSPDERRDAIAWLETKKWGHEEPYMKAYQILTTDPHPMVRAQAMMALGTSYQPPMAIPFLIKGLQDRDVQVRRDAANGLRRTWGDEAIPPLVVRLKEDEDEQVRASCARALAHARSPEAVRALIDSLADRDAAVAKYSHDSLVAATGQNLWYDQRAWLTWYQQTYMAPATQNAQPG